MTAITRAEVFEALDNAVENGYGPAMQASSAAIAADLNACTGIGDYLEEADYLAQVVPLIDDWKRERNP